MELDDFMAEARAFWRKLGKLKEKHPLEGAGWYPYDSLSAVASLQHLLKRDFELLPPLWKSEPVLDLGCADADLAFFLESLGAEVDAVDYAEMNFNQLAGARRLRELLDARVNTYSVNLDWYFELPRKRYGLVLFLGILYHLKNPFYVMERLAHHGAYCLLSTRVARTTGPDGVAMEDQPVAYLLDPREANDDPTNYWIFSVAGLERLAERTGWSVVARQAVGCASRSNPVDAEADERMFLLLKSRVRYPDLGVRLLDGWHEIEEDGWRWTGREFSFELTLPRQRKVKEFALSFAVPEAVVESGGVQLSCEMDGKPAEQVEYRQAGSQTFRGAVAGDARKVVIRFRVEHGFRPAGDDSRELGIRVSFADELAGGRSGLPLRLS
jgi:tRNA (mo5U34)-methyltransferase